MEKIAFFVEGKTEQVFLERLLLEIFGQKKIAVETKKIIGGSKIPKKILEIKTPIKNSENEYYAIIYDCGTESRVASEVKDQRESLLKSGYSKIVGIRDVFPLSDIKKLEQFMYYGMPTKDIKISFVLSIMEIEAWFLAEHTHFQKIDNNLTVDKIVNTLGFNPVSDDMQARINPANDLDNCYQIVGKRYTKKSENIQRTVDALDYGSMYLDTCTRVSSLNQLIAEIEDIFK